MTRRRKRTYRIRPVRTERDSSGAAACSSPEERALATYKRPRRALIAEAAYYRALRRGFRDGDPLEDWLAAEAEIDAMLGAPRASPAQPSGETSRSTARNQR